MRLINTIFILICFLSTNYLAQEKTFSPEEQELIDLIKKIDEAEQKDDWATFYSLHINQPLVMFGTVFKIQTADKTKLDQMVKAAEASKNEKNHRVLVKFSDFKVNLLGDYAVVLAKEIVTQKVRDMTLVFNNQFTFFCAKEEGKWKVAAWQVFTLDYSSYPKSSPVTFDILPLPEKLKSYSWKKIAEDKQGDGFAPASADGKALSYFFEKESDMLWLKYELYNAVDSEKPAVTLSIDSDANQQTGEPWYGVGSTFKFDKMLHLGVTERICDTKVKGFNGITSAAASHISNWLDIKKNNLFFYISPEEKAYYLGVKRSDLGTNLNKLNIVSSVGENGVWNDDMGEGFATIAFK